MDHRGTCQMLSHAHCNFLGGFFHLDKEHCVEVSVTQAGVCLGQCHPGWDVLRSVPPWQGGIAGGIAVSVTLAGIC